MPAGTSARQRVSAAPPAAYYNLGIAYQMLGDNEKAVKNFQRFVSRAPGHDQAAMARV